MASLSIRDVYKTYPNGVPVLKGVNIDIEDGQFLILVGGSGCGKSALLNMIAGLEDVTQGDIMIDGKTVNNLSPKDREIAIVFQSYALYPSMSVRDNISFGLNIRKVPKDEQKKIVDRVSETLQIGHLLDRKPGQLSGCQRQRVAMGRALARDPVMFLFDEPLSNLDAKLRIEMRSEIKLLHQRLGTTIVYVTHDQIEAMDARRPHRGDKGRRHRAAIRRAAGNLRFAGQSVRCGIHRRAAHELHQREARRYGFRRRAGNGHGHHAANAQAALRCEPSARPCRAGSDSRLASGAHHRFAQRA